MSKEEIEKAVDGLVESRQLTSAKDDAGDEKGVEAITRKFYRKIKAAAKPSLSRLKKEFGDEVDRFATSKGLSRASVKEFWSDIENDLPYS